jgi:hypothetical protein
MEDPNHYLRSIRKNNRRRGRIGGNTSPRNPSAQETMNGPRQSESRRDVGHGPKKTGTQKGKNETTQPTNEQTKQAKGAREIAPNPITQEPGGNKRLAMQEGGAHTKSKAQ